MERGEEGTQGIVLALFGLSVSDHAILAGLRKRKVQKKGKYYPPCISASMVGAHCVLKRSPDPFDHHPLDVSDYHQITAAFGFLPWR